MRERKLRSTAESLLRFRGSLISYNYNMYKIKRKVKGKNTMRICTLSVPRLKDEWNQTVWSVNNLRCGTAACPGFTTCPSGQVLAISERRAKFLLPAPSALFNGSAS